jgi:hypothetical protein
MNSKVGKVVESKKGYKKVLLMEGISNFFYYKYIYIILKRCG